jgi:preprotein translocase subunit SecD
MLEFPRWKYVLVTLLLLAALLFALPNFFGEDPALQVVRRNHAVMDTAAREAVEALLRQRAVQTGGTYVDSGRLIVRFGAVPEQLKGRDAVNEALGADYLSALTNAPRAPAFLRRLGLRPMPLGLDLRGGLYLLYQVDVDGAVSQLLESYEQGFRRALVAANLNFTDVTTTRSGGGVAAALNADGLRVTLPADADPEAVRAALARANSDLTFTVSSTTTGPAVDMTLSPTQIRTRQDYAIEQNITTLRNRVNELGVSEPIVQRQGLDRVNVQLPGVQNSAEVKDILGKVATLEFRLADTVNNAYDAQQRGLVPLGSKLYKDRTDRPVLLKREVIVTGDQLTNAISAASTDGPAVSVTLDGRGGDSMLRTTRANVGKPMAVVYIEKSRQTVEENGQKVQRDVTEQNVISVATIRGVFSNQFQISGLTAGEARDLALLLRAGSLAAPIYIIEERAIGPSLGQDNIDQGVRALLIGMLALFAFMAFYYRAFGLVANLVLLLNVVMLTALLSILRASLSLPGIAGIILTVGMAVDANVLIYERIREELRNGVSPQAAIRAGFDKAFSAIADSNVTTLIAGLVLWVVGTGPVRGFAIVLTLGIATSMFTSLLGSRALLTLFYGGRRRVAKLSIG